MTVMFVNRSGLNKQSAQTTEPLFFFIYISSSTSLLSFDGIHVVVYRGGRGRAVVGFTTIYAISAYHH
jgi:hypothetical protein